MKGNNQVCFECEEVIQVPQGGKVIMHRGQPTCDDCNPWNVPILSLNQPQPENVFRYERENMEVVWDNRPILEYPTGFPIPPEGGKVTRLLRHIEEDGTPRWKFVTTWVDPETGEVVWDGRVIFDYATEFPPPLQGVKFPLTSAMSKRAGTINEDW